MKLWKKEFGLDKQVEEFTVGNDYVLDLALVKYDCIASIAHAKMLAKVGLLEAAEADKLEVELNNIIALHEKGEFKIEKEQEDCHTAIENHLTEKLGELGKKIHTARSRNDQVLTALRLYFKDEIDAVTGLSEALKGSIEAFTTKYGEIALPGYTHTRKAMPSTIKMWGSAFSQALADDLLSLEHVKKLVDQSPLGSAAGYGVPLDIDREMTAQELGFAKVQESPIYVQHSRGKFEAAILHTLSQVMFDLNKIASDLILFSMPVFGYFEIPPECTTGSSIMPQKKNPDVLELVRAKYHVVTSLEMQLKSMTANLISGYHRDFQLTKEPVMNGFKITKDSLAIMALMFEKLGVNKESCSAALTDELYATEKVYELVKQGLPFRDAYQKIAKDFE